VKLNDILYQKKALLGSAIMLRLLRALAENVRLHTGLDTSLQRGHEMT
jgi:hypothetical protein